MCGFCCYFHFDRPEGFPDLDLDTSLQYIHHRGPDAKSKYVSPDGRCGKVIGINKKDKYIYSYSII